MSSLSRLYAKLPAFVKRSGLSFGLRFGGLFLQFVASIIIARILGVEGFGVYAYAFTIVVLVGTLLGLGFGQLAVRELPRHLSRGEHAFVRGFLLAGLSVTLISAGIAAGVLAWLERTGMIPHAVSWPLLTLAALVQALTVGLAAVLNGFQRVLQSQVVETVIRQGLFLLVVCGLFAAGYSFSPVRMFTTFFLVSVPILIVLVWMVRRALLTTHTPNNRSDPQFVLGVWLAAGLPLMVIGFINQMQTSLDVLMIGSLGEAADVGRYRAASRAADLVLIANGIALHLLEPILSRNLALHDKAGAQRAISQSTTVSAAFGLTICLALGLGAESYLGLFGPDFVTAAPVLRLLVAGQALAIFCGPVAVILVMLNRERLVLVVTLAALAGNFGLMLLLIPAYGIIGAAIATFTSVVLVKIVLLGVVLRLSDFDPTLWTPLFRRDRLRRD